MQRPQPDPVYPDSTALQRAAEYALRSLRERDWVLEPAGNPSVHRDGWCGYSFFWYPKGYMRDTHATIIKVFVPAKAPGGTQDPVKLPVGGAPLARAGSPEPARPAHGAA